MADPVTVRRLPQLRAACRRAQRGERVAIQVEGQGRLVLMSVEDAALVEAVEGFVAARLARVGEGEPEWGELQPLDGAP